MDPDARIKKKKEKTIIWSSSQVKFNLIQHFPMPNPDIAVSG
jgi:hypothetical protein